MVERADIVLAAIPVLALGGPLAAEAASLLESTVGVGGAVAALPLTGVGLLAALSVILGTILLRPPGAEA